MARVKRANVILDIKDSEVQRYLDLGYNVIDTKGNVLQQCIPTDVGELQKAYVENMAKIKELEATIESLQKPKSKPKTTTKKVEE